jgi:hypothetical protein
MCGVHRACDRLVGTVQVVYTKHLTIMLSPAMIQDELTYGNEDRDVSYGSTIAVLRRQRNGRGGGGGGGLKF